MTRNFFRHCRRLCGEEDKHQHFWASLALILVPFSLWQNMLGVTLVALLVGLLKEVWDHFYGSGFCWFDMAANLLGMGCGLLLAGLVLALRTL